MSRQKLNKTEKLENKGWIGRKGLHFFKLQSKEMDQVLSFSSCCYLVSIMHYYYYYSYIVVSIIGKSLHFDCPIVTLLFS